MTCYDYDLDGLPDFQDLDSDGDGLTDLIEAGGTDADTNGLVDSFADAGPQDGYDDNLASAPLADSDQDSDGLENRRDLDSDNDGITDNREAQGSSVTLPSGADADGDGIDNAYDNDFGTLVALVPVNTDASGLADYLDTDADNDQVPDKVEGHDANQDGYGNWDTDSDGDITDESGYNTDTDGDGILNIFDTYASGYASIVNISSSNAALQNTDGADNPDWRDTDDDNDGLLTSSTGTGNENSNSNSSWADDFDQGQVVPATIPNYLFRGDYDGDGIADANDLDDDNDGIPDEEEQYTYVLSASGLAMPMQ